LNPRQIAYTALYLALAIVLPIGFHQLGVAGRIFLPMHIPVLLAGFTLGPLPGVLVGLIAPLLSHLTTGMPPAYAVPLMTVELAIYGLIAGLVYFRFESNIYIALVIAMIAGRIAFAGALLLLGLFVLLPYGVAEYLAAGGALVTGLPGIILQIVIIPPLVIAVRRQLARTARKAP